ncbi:MAG TPA: sensor histidine kinase [Anaerolineae bacterium]|nr:sensor histidine kinase [Anaerolineae bacterium]
MQADTGWQPRLARRLHRLPILNRLLIGNSLVIIVGAIGGTLLTRYLTYLPSEANIWLILLFATLGISLSLLVNYWIVKLTLHPLRELRERVDRVLAGPALPHERLPEDLDPNLSRLAAAINSMLDRLDDYTLQMRALTERAINAQEEERKRIARQLHDDSAQSMSTLIINLERLEKIIPPDRPDVQTRLAAACQLAKATLVDLREVAYDLRPTMLDDLGLIPAIRWYARSRLGDAGVAVRFDTADEAARLPPQLETTLYRIAQEAITNIVHHAGATTVTINLARTNGHIRLRVTDDGCGFDVTQIPRQAVQLRRLGLLGVRERAELVGGTVNVSSQPGHGTQLEVSLPVPEVIGVDHG